MKPHDNRAWLLILPAALIMGFVGLVLLPALALIWFVRNHIARGFTIRT